jgi:polar amino acid transport system substrate-binding protein
VFAQDTEVIAAAKAGTLDMVFANTTPARRNNVDCLPTVLQVAQDYPVPAGSAIRVLEQIDRAGVRVGVGEGSTSEATLSRAFRNATVVRTPSPKAAVDMLTSGRMEAFATNRTALFEMAKELPALRALDGGWGLESLASAFCPVVPTHKGVLSG